MKYPLRALSSVIMYFSFGTSQIAAHDLTFMQSAVMAHLNMSQSRCEQLARNECNRAFDECLGGGNIHAGRRGNITVMYTCFRLGSGVQTLVVSGAQTGGSAASALDRAVQASVGKLDPFFK